MIQNELKRAVGWKALQYINYGDVVGVGTGSTVGYFIDALESIKWKIKGTVSSSRMSTEKLKSLGIKVLDLNEIKNIEVYIDSADEINESMQMIKGGGGALTQEKIIASIAKTFVCIVDISKQVPFLGCFPLPIEIIPIARYLVARQLEKLGGRPKLRKDFITDNGNLILDIHDLKIFNAVSMENKINIIPGVVTVGIFANRCADIALISTSNGIKTMFKRAMT